jgi:hypothetical protein
MTELRGRACPAWTAQEDQVLRTRWVAGGYQAVREYLPRRTYSAIVTRASTLRLRAPAHVRKRPQRYFTTEHIDRVIRDGYLDADTLSALDALRGAAGETRGACLSRLIREARESAS